MLIWNEKLKPCAPRAGDSGGSAFAPRTEDDVREVLSHIDPNCDRERWTHVICGAMHELGKTEVAFDIVDEWSSAAESYKRADMRAVWSSFKPDGGRTFGTLVEFAKQEHPGFKLNRGAPQKITPEEAAKREADRAARKAVHDAEEANEAADAKERATKRWVDAEKRTATADHPYLKKKGIQPHGLRVGEWQRNIAEPGAEPQFITLKDVLYIPMLDRKGKNNIHSLQGITVEGDKLFMSGGVKKGHFYPLGKPQIDPDTQQPIFVFAEGFATGASIHESTGDMVFCCFDLGNMVEVVKQVRASRPDAILIIAADNDTETDGNPGMTRATAAAIAYHAHLAAPPPGDFNDFVVRARDNGLSEERVAALVQKLIGAATVPTEPFVAPGTASAAVPAAEERSGKVKAGPAAASSSPGERRTITIIAGEIPRVCDEAEAALKATRDQLYQRGGQIVRPMQTVVDATNGNKTKIVQIHPLNKHALVEEFSLAAEWQKWDARATDYVPTNPPLNIAETLMARGRSTLRPLTAVIEAPTLRRDGSILEAPGYDEETGLLLAPGDQFPSVPLAPSRDDAVAACEHLLSLVKHYPFVSAEARSVWLVAVLTAVVRRSLPTAPAFGFTATTAGSGKSALVDLISIIGFGVRVPVTTQGRDEAETEKRLVGQLLAANGIISIDNATQPIDGDLLCQMLTQSTVSVRSLGGSKIVYVPTSMVVCATGNNLVIAGDMTRRALLCQLDANDERPELRQFDFNPLEVAETGRVQYLIAALTILRAFSCAGMPQQANKLGSFERWSELVRGAVLWLGMADPVSTMERVRRADPKLECLRNVMEQWAAVFKDGAKKVREIIDAAAKEAFPPNGSRYERPDLREALLVAAGTNGAINSAKLGHYLKGVSGRIVNGFRFIKGGEYQGVTLWKLEQVDGAGPLMEEGPPL